MPIYDEKGSLYTGSYSSINDAARLYDSQFSRDEIETPVGQYYSETPSKYDIGIPASEYNINEWRAQEQSVGNRLLKAAPRVINTALSEIAKMPGYAVGLGMAATTDLNIGDALDNQWIRGIEEAKKHVDDEWLSVYIPESVRNGNLLDNIGSSSFWATEGADGVGFMLSFLVPGAALRAIGAGAKGVELLNLISKGAKLGDTGADLIRGGVKFGSKAAKNIDDIGAVAVNATLESAAEATETYKNALRTYKDKGFSEEEANEMAGKAAAGAFNTNLVLLAATGAMTQRQLFGAFRSKGDKGILGQLFDEEGKLIQGLGAKTIAQKLPKAGKELAKGILSEGFLEEGLQSAAQKYFQDKQLHPDDYDTVIEGLVGSYMEGMKDVDMQKAVLLGSVLGGMQGAISTYREVGEEDKQLYGSGVKSPSKLFKALGAQDREGTKGVYKTLQDGLIEKLDLSSVKDLFVQNPDGTYQTDATGRRTVDANKLGSLIEKVQNKDAALALMLVAKELGDTQTFNRYFLGSKTSEFIEFLKEDNGLELLNKYIDSQLAQAEVDKYGDTFGLKVNEVKNTLKTFAQNLNNNYNALVETHGATFKVPKGDDTEAWKVFNNKVFNNKLSAGLLIDETVEANNKLKEEKAKLASKSEETRTPIDSIREKQLDQAIKLNEDIVAEAKTTLTDLLDNKKLSEEFEVFKANRNKVKEEVQNQAEIKEPELGDILRAKGYPNFEDAKRSIYFDNGDKRLVAQKDKSGQWFVYSDQDLSTPLKNSSNNPIVFNKEYFTTNKKRITILSREEAANRIVQERRVARFHTEFKAAQELIRVKDSQYKENQDKLTKLYKTLEKYRTLLKSDLKSFSVAEAQEFIAELNTNIESIEKEIATLEQQNETLATAIEFLTQRVEDATKGVGWYSPTMAEDKLEQGLNSRIDSRQVTEVELFSPEQAQEVIDANNSQIATLQDSLNSLVATRDKLQAIVDKSKKLRTILYDALNNSLLNINEKTTARQVAVLLDTYNQRVGADTFVATLNQYDTREIVHFINTELDSIKGGKRLSVDSVIGILNDRIRTNEAPLIALNSQVQDLEAELYTLQSKTNFLIEGSNFANLYNTYQPIIAEWKKASNRLFDTLNKPQGEQQSTREDLGDTSNDEARELAKKAHAAKRINPYSTGGRNFEYKDGYGSIYPEVWDVDGYPTQTIDLDQQRWFKFLDSNPDLKNALVRFIAYKNIDSQDIPVTLKETIKAQLEGKDVDIDNALFAVIVNSEGDPLVDGQGKYYYTSINTTERLFDGERPLIYLDAVIKQELTDTAPSGDEATVGKLFNDKIEGNELLNWAGQQITKDELYEQLVTARKAEIREAYDNWRLEIFNTIASKGVAYTTPVEVSNGVMVTHRTEKFLVKNSADLSKGWKFVIGKEDGKTVTSKGNKVVSGRVVIETPDGTEIPVSMPTLNEVQVNTVIALLRYAISGTQAGLNKHIKLAGGKYTLVDGKQTNGTYPVFHNTKEGNIKSNNRNALLSNIINWGKGRRDVNTPGEIYLDTANRDIVFTTIGKESVQKRIKFDELFKDDSPQYQELRDFLFTKRLNINEAVLTKGKSALYLQPEVNGATLSISDGGLKTKSYSSYEEYLLQFMETPLIPKNNPKGLPQFANRHVIMGKDIISELTPTQVSSPSPAVTEQPDDVKSYSIVSPKTGSTTIYTITNGRVSINNVLSKDGTPITDPAVLEQISKTIQENMESFVNDSKLLEEPLANGATNEMFVPKESAPEVPAQPEQQSTAPSFKRKQNPFDHVTFLTGYNALPQGAIREEYMPYLEKSVWDSQSPAEQKRILNCIKG